LVSPKIANQAIVPPTCKSVPVFAARRALLAGGNRLEVCDHRIGKAIAEPKQVAFGTPQKGLQLRAPLHERLIAKITRI
jgi:hypothetical protein